MNFEFLVEDASGGTLLALLVPKILGPDRMAHSWRIHSYRGLGRIPKNLKAQADPAKRKLLHRLPDILAGYDNVPGYDFIIVVMDADARDCAAMLAGLLAIKQEKAWRTRVMFRLAIEEMEAWYLGDQPAIKSAYPQAKLKPLASYQQDSVCGTWETLLDVTHQKSAQAIRKSGWMAAGKIKQEWAACIGPWMDIETNLSASFCKFRDGLRRMSGAA